MIFELTGVKSLVAHVIIANFIALNVCMRLPLGLESFSHRYLQYNETWCRLGGEDSGVIETDEQEMKAQQSLGIHRLKNMRTNVIKFWVMCNLDRMRMSFDAWCKQAEATGFHSRRELKVLQSHREQLLTTVLGSKNEDLLRLAWQSLVFNYICDLKDKSRKAANTIAQLQMAAGNSVGEPAAAELAQGDVSVHLSQEVAVHASQEETEQKAPDNQDEVYYTSAQSTECKSLPDQTTTAERVTEVESQSELPSRAPERLVTEHLSELPCLVPSDRADDFLR